MTEAALQDRLTDIEAARQLGLEIAELCCRRIEDGSHGAGYGVIIEALQTQLKFWRAQNQ